MTHRPFDSKPRFLPGAFVMTWAVVISPVAAELPENMLYGLKADAFKTRVETQQQLLDWARKNPEESMESLYHRSLNDGDPEVRVRCLNVLRELVGDAYLKDGKGYVGIMMGIAGLPGAKPQAAEKLRVDLVVRDGPADKAGIKVGDLVLKINGKPLPRKGVMDAFRNTVQNMQPGDEIILAVERGDENLDLKVVLGKLPGEVGRGFLIDPEISLEEMEEKAKEAHFQEWLAKRRKLRKP